MNEKQLANALERAQQLMNDNTFNGLVESKSRNVNFTANGEVIYDKRDNSTHSDFVENFSSTKNKGIPQEILESFKRVPCPDIPSSRMDCVVESVKPKQIPRPNMVNENINYGGSNIDYSIIKAIVNECISSQLNLIKESLINESTLRGFTIKEGNKVQFLSKNGDLYEGEMKLKKKKK